MDGDGRNLVYFGLKTDKGWPEHAEVSLADTDKIFSVAMRWIRDKLYRLKLEEKVSHGIVQTCATNSACAGFFKTVGI